MEGQGTRSRGAGRGRRPRAARALVTAVDVRWILAAQAGRAFGYGVATVLLGAVLAGSGLSPARVGLVLAVVVAGTVVASLLVGTVGDRVGRRRSYLVLYGALAGSRPPGSTPIRHRAGAPP